MIVIIVIIKFWKIICCNEKEHDAETEQTEAGEKRMNKDIDQKECEDIELKEPKFSLKKLQKQKSTEFEEIPNFSLSTLTPTHKC